jgi:plant G-box-binding factor
MKNPCLFTGDASQNGNSVHGPQNGGPAIVNQAMAMVPISGAGAAPLAVAGPTTNLNIGMDYWAAPNSSAIPAMRGKGPAPVAGGFASGSRDSVQSQPWLQVRLSSRIIEFSTSVQLLKSLSSPVRPY